jgi:hypothetical protein
MVTEKRQHFKLSYKKLYVIVIIIYIFVRVREVYFPGRQQISGPRRSRGVRNMLLMLLKCITIEANFQV